MIAAMWSLVQYPSAKSRWSLERKVRAIKEAGFHGLATTATPKLKKLADKYGLVIIGYVASGNAKEFHKLLKDNADNGAHYINVQLADEDTLTPEALKLTLQLMKDGEKIGCEPAVEIHRDTCTEAPEKAYALADAYRKATGKLLPMALDYSHVSVVKHLHPGNYALRLLVQPKLIQRVEQIHLRPFNGHHCQIPVTDGKGKLTPEIKDWIPFAEALFRVWAKENRTDANSSSFPKWVPSLAATTSTACPTAGRKPSCSKASSKKPGKPPLSQPKNKPQGGWPEKNTKRVAEELGDFFCQF